MIGKLSGIIDSFSSDRLLLDVGGVGYIVHCSARTLTRAGQKGDALSLLIDLHLREDSLTLYGFLEAGEQQWFRLLTSVQGVGAKVAMAILAACPMERLGYAILSGDKAALLAADGVGPKLALRILTELKDKVAKMDISPQIAAQEKAGKSKKSESQNSVPIIAADLTLDQDAVSALINLGYARADAFQAVATAKQKANDNERGQLQTLIRLALKELSA